MEHKEILGSSSVKSVGYDAATRTLEVKFHGSSGTYAYQNVPWDVHAKLAMADSAGKFIHKVLKPNYHASKVS